VSPPYAAELRVYEPLSAFPAGERAWLEDYAASGSVPTGRGGPRLERVVGLVAACRPVARVPRPGEAGENAYILGGESGLLACPWRTELRSWRSATELASLLPAEVLDAVLPAAELEVAARQHELWLSEHPDQRAHILSSRWVVPVRWFLLFHRDERRLQLGGQTPRGRSRRSPGSPGSRGSRSSAGPAKATGAAGSIGATGAGDAAAASVTAPGRSLVYRTPMAQARRRTARGLAVLRRAFDTGPVVGAVESLGRWLEEFHPRSVVELDYGGLVDLRSDTDLRADDSAGDITEALVALGAGEVERATAAYDRVIERWRIAHRVESAN
jgi:hypothetical protein